MVTGFEAKYYTDVSNIRKELTEIKEILKAVVDEMIILVKQQQLELKNKEKEYFK